MELETLRNDYIQLSKLRDATLAKNEHYVDMVIELKERNANLCMAIASIPELEYSGKKNEKDKCRLSTALKKAKQLAQKGGVITNTPVVVIQEKKRKADEEPRVKRAYKKRASLTVTPISKQEEEEEEESTNILRQTSTQKRVSEHPHTSSDSSQSGEEEEESNEKLIDITHSLLSTWPAEYDLAKHANTPSFTFTVTDVF